MSYFGRNIRKIRNAKKISQTAFADLFELKRGSIGAYEEGRAEAKIDTVIEIADYFQLTLDQLLRKELTFNEIYHLAERSRRFEQKNKDKILSTSIERAKSSVNLPEKQEDIKLIDKITFGEIASLFEERLIKIEERLIGIEKRLTED